MYKVKKRNQGKLEANKYQSCSSWLQIVYLYKIIAILMYYKVNAPYDIHQVQSKPQILFIIVMYNP